MIVALFSIIILLPILNQPRRKSLVTLRLAQLCAFQISTAALFQLHLMHESEVGPYLYPFLILNNVRVHVCKGHVMQEQSGIERLAHELPEA